MSRSIAYTSSPLLASPTPVWRSKFIVAAIALAFAGLAVRAVYIQVLANDAAVIGLKRRAGQGQRALYTHRAIARGCDRQLSIQRALTESAA